MKLEDVVMACIAEALMLDHEAAGRLGPDTALLGVHPDFTSMAVLTLVTALEERLGLSIIDDLQAEALVSVGSLTDEIRRRSNPEALQPR